MKGLTRAMWRPRSRCTAFLAGALLTMASAPAAGQGDFSIEDFAGAYLGANAQGYFGPLAEVVTGALNSGFMAPVPPQRGVSVRLGLITPLALIGQGQKTFSATTEEGFSPRTTREAPTFVGSPEPVIVEGDGGTGYIFPGGLNLSSLGLAAPQLTVGGLRGTEATVRWFGLSVNEELGDVSLLGVGLRHNVSQYFAGMPVKIAVGALYNSFELGDVLDVTASLVTVHGSRSLGVLELYGGAAYEDGSMKVRYDSDAAEDGEVSVDLDGAQGLRGTVGAALVLPLVALHADYTLGSQPVLGVGLSIGTRY